MGVVQRIMSREVLGSLLAAVLVVAAEHAFAIRWLGLQTIPSPVWNTTSVCRQARHSQYLNQRQTRLCRTSTAAVATVARAASMAISICQEMLQDRRWNCSSILHAPHFTPDLSSGTREQAFVYALSAAAVTYTLSRACAAGLLPYCACATLPQEPPDGNFKWGGCGDNLRWATQFAKQFIDSSERQRGKSKYFELMMGGISNNSTVVEMDHRGIWERMTMSLVNLHNNRVGRRAVEDSVRSQCKCHGVSGSCSIRTCWRALPSRLQEVAVRLLRRYPQAVAVRATRAAVGRRLLPARPAPGPLYTQDDLLYLTDSPDYCHRDYRTGSVGTYGSSS